MSQVIREERSSWEAGDKGAKEIRFYVHVIK